MSDPQLLVVTLLSKWTVGPADAWAELSELVARVSHPGRPWFLVSSSE